MDAGTWMGIGAMVISAFFAFLFWACCRVGGQWERELEPWSPASHNQSEADGRPEGRTSPPFDQKTSF